MKRKVTAILCATSILLVNAAALADIEDVAPESPEIVSEDIVPAEESIIETTALEETPPEDENSELLLTSSPEAEPADKSGLSDALALVEGVLPEMVSDEAIAAAFSAALEEAQSVLENEEADQDSVDAAAESLLAAAGDMEKLIRDYVFEALNSCVDVDNVITSPETYAAYSAAYTSAQNIYWDETKTMAQLYDAGYALNEAYDGLEIVARESILTPNVVTEDAKSRYAGIQNDILPNISYTYPEDANPEIPQNDPTFSKLFQGEFDGTVAGNAGVMHSKWNWHDLGYIEFDLGQDAYITGVDVWEFQRYAHSKIGTVEVWVSSNGTDYELAGSLVEENGGEILSEWKLAVNFDPVRCRYIRIGLKTANCYHYILNEVVIRGYKAAEISKTPITLEQVDYLDENGDRTMNLRAESVKVTGFMVNNTDENLSATVITAAYKDGDILDLVFSKKSVGAGGEVRFNTTVAIGGDEDAEIFTFVWEDIAAGKALSSVKGFGLSRHNMPEIAADSEGAKYDMNNGKMSLWGSTTANGFLKDVTMLVLKSGVSLEDFAALTNTRKKEAILYLEQTAPANDGKYAFEYKPFDVTTMYGNNNVYVKVQDEDVKHYKVLFIDENAENQAVRAFEAAETVEAMLEALGAYSFIYGGVDALDAMIAKHTEEVILPSVAEKILEIDFTDAKDAVSEIVKAAVLTDINLCAAADEVIEVVKAYSAELGLADNGIYKELYKGTEYISRITAEFVGQEYETAKAFTDDFVETIVVDKLNSIKNYTEIMDILEPGRDVLEGFDFDGYDDLAPMKKARVHKAVANRTDYESLEDVRDAFNEAVENPGEDKSYGGGGSGSGGTSISSSGKGSGTSISMVGTVAEEVLPFNDLGSVIWAKDSILTLYEKGIVSGMGESTFAPNNNVTREQFTTMLVSAFGLLDKNAECSFEDCEINGWYYPYVASAAASRIVYGISDTCFGVGTNITREDMAVLSYRTLMNNVDKVVYDKEGIDNFTDDAEISEYAREAVYAMRGTGIMQGRGNNEFAPKAYATRAEAAKIIYGICGSLIQ